MKNKSEITYRFNAVQEFMLVNDSPTVATEVPVGLKSSAPLTGHIDIVQVISDTIRMDQEKHMEFLYGYPLAHGIGFIWGLWYSFDSQQNALIDEPKIILSAYYAGYDAARDDDLFSVDESYAQLEDDGDGISHEKNNMGGDGILAASTYL